MEFSLAKIVGYALSPLTIVLGLLLGSFLLRRGKGVTLGVMALGILWLLSTPILVQALSRPIDEHYPEMDVANAPVADAILVLGGALSGARPPLRQFTIGAAGDRVWRAAALFRARKAPYIVVAAGNQDPDDGAQPEAEGIAELLVAMGVPRDRILLETRSRNTRENAIFSLPLVQGIGARKVLLVTSARHMRRALETFHHQWKDDAIELVPAVCDMPQPVRASSVWAWLPSLAALGLATQVTKEYLGLLALEVLS